MSAKSEVYAALTATGIPGRYEAYPVKKSPAPPSAQPLLRYPVLLAEPAERG